MKATPGVWKITWDELRDKGYPSVTDLCRDLVKEKEEYEMGGGPGKLKEITLPEKIEVYRGEMLCLTVNDVYEAAKLMPTDHGFRKYDPTKRGIRRKASLQPQGDV